MSVSSRTPSLLAPSSSQIPAGRRHFAQPALRALSALALATTAFACSVEAGRTGEGDEGAAAATEGAWNITLLSPQRITADDKSNIYVTTANGALLWYRDNGRNGTWSWARGGGNRIGKGWGADVVDIAAAENGVFYVLKTNGYLYWYRNEPLDGNVAWDAKSGTIVRYDLGNVTKLIYGGEGNLYVLRSNGDLAWYKDLARDGRVVWAPNGNVVIGTGWGGMKQIFTCNDNTLYAVDGSGNLRWYRDNGRNGTWSWDWRSGSIINNGWGDMRHAFCGGAGNLYAVDSAGSLRWYKDVARDGTWSWAPGYGSQIGTGWGAIATPTAGLRACGSNGDCPDHQECASGVCRLAANSAWCDGPTRGRNARGDHADCGAYICDPSFGTCKTRCSTSADCSSSSYPCVGGYCQAASTDGSGDYFKGPGQRELASTAAYRETIDVGACSGDANCATGETCQRGVCMRQSVWCSDDLKARVVRGTPYDCGNYKCDALSASCRGTCYDFAACDSVTCNPVSMQCGG